MGRDRDRDRDGKKKGEKREKRPIRKKKCKFCLDRVTHIDYKDERRIRRFMTDRGKITPRRITGTLIFKQVRRQVLVGALPHSPGVRLGTLTLPGQW